MYYLPNKHNTIKTQVKNEKEKLITKQKYTSLRPTKNG